MLSLKQKTREKIYHGLDLFLLGNALVTGVNIAARFFNVIPNEYSNHIANYNIIGYLIYSGAMVGMMLTRANLRDLPI